MSTVLRKSHLSPQCRSWWDLEKRFTNKATSTLSPLKGPVSSLLKECPRPCSFKATQSFHYCVFCLLEIVSPSSASRNPPSPLPKAHGHMKREASSLCSSASLFERGLRSQPPPDRLCLHQEQKNLQPGSSQALRLECLLCWVNKCKINLFLCCPRTILAGSFTVKDVILSKPKINPASEPQRQSCTVHDNAFAFA